MHHQVAIVILCLSVVLFSNGKLYDLNIEIHNGNESTTLIKTITVKNETLITDIVIEDEENLTTLKRGTFKKLHFLHTIRIHRTNLSELEADIFTGLRRLKKVNLNFNTIGHIPADVFKDIPVYTIELKSNGIRTISENAFYNLNNLHTLDLSVNDIELLPKNMFVRTCDLKILDLSHNRLRHFPAVPYKPYSFFDIAFAKMAEGESSVLDLSHNNFTFVSYYLLRGIRYIGELKLNDNGIRSISEYAFDDFRRITLLNLEQNDLHEISNGLLDKLTAVDFLNLKKNPWNKEFVCKYNDWCILNKQYNYMDARCPTKLEIN